MCLVVSDEVRPQNDRAISEFYLLQVFPRGSYFDENFENFKIFERMKINKEITRENRVNRRREDVCSTSYSSGNQVDGLSLVAIPKQ